MREHRIQADWQDDSGQRPRSAAAHRISNRDAHGRSGTNAVALESFEKLLQVLYGHASTRSASGDSGHIGSVKAEFGHTGLHSGRQIRGACRRRRHRQSFDGRFDLTWADGHGLALGSFSVRCFRGGFLESQSGGFLGIDFDISKDRSDRIALPLLHENLGKMAAAGGGYLHDGLVGLDFNHIAVACDRITLTKEHLDDCCFGDRFAELWHENGDESHRFTFPADAASQKLSRSRLDDAPTTDRDDTGPEYLSH